MMTKVSCGFYSEVWLHFGEKVGGFEEKHQKKTETVVMVKQSGGAKRTDRRAKPPTERQVTSSDSGATLQFKRGTRKEVASCAHQEK